MSATELEDLQRQSGLVGEDAAVFSFEEQSLKSWGAFLAVLGTVLTALYYLWLNPDTGYGEFPADWRTHQTAISDVLMLICAQAHVDIYRGGHNPGVVVWYKDYLFAAQ